MQLIFLGRYDGFVLDIFWIVVYHFVFCSDITVLSNAPMPHTA